eukprot:TRINITY_DN76570_c0_g1_i1.p1 TRINITY_DN76570_c0_g1~~TRINITY_DN76570_c0_g1_i1.p1  ORF type:complete len:365 (+),score=58.33 TRINITY_DN76570_c0_g1_i1:76-1170(+)
MAAVSLHLSPVPAAPQGPRCVTRRCQSPSVLRRAAQQFSPQFSRRGAASASAAAGLLLGLEPSRAAAGRKKTAVVTGASSGIGYAAAALFLKLGWRVIPSCRSKRTAAETVAALRDEAPDATVELVNTGCELADLDSVVEYSKGVQSLGGPVDALVLNAGVDGAPESERSKLGLEPHFAVNYLGHFLLYKRLLPQIREAGDGRVVTVTSSAAVEATLDLQDLGWKQRTYERAQAYAASKACDVLFSDEIARREAASGIVSGTVDPGPTVSKIVRYSQPERAAQREDMDEREIARQARMLSFNTPDESATGLVWCATASEVASQTGGWWIGPRVPVPDVQLAWRNESVAKELWQRSEDLVKPYLA